MASIDPKLWGPSAWLLLHDVSFYIAAKNNAKSLQDIKPFFMSLRHILPCIRCQLSYDMHLLHLPFPTKSKDLPKWVYDLHNRVNDTIAKNITKPMWNTWSIEYKRDLTSHKLKDIWPFIQSIAETYPSGSNYEIRVYQENVEIFFKILWDLLRNMKGYSTEIKHIEMMLLPKELDKNIQTEKLFKEWITNIGRTVHIAYEKHYQCSNTCKK